MGKDKLRALAVVLTQTIRQNVCIGLPAKESVKAKLNAPVRQILRKL
jgi:type I restriction enzyme R subunit